MTSQWYPDSLKGVTTLNQTTLPVIKTGTLSPAIPGRYLWDQCPVVDASGVSLTREGAELWIGLSAPITSDPVTRHEHARLRLVLRSSEGWIDCGNILPDTFSNGSREWAGAMYVGESNAVTLYYTATGTAGERHPTYRQRIFEATATLNWDSRRPRLVNWIDRGEPIHADGLIYELANQADGEPGAIKSFRDPYYFRDPASGTEILLFSASDARASTSKNGAIGYAARNPDSQKWELQNPLVTGDGATNEMERPHIVKVGNRFYLFWSVHGWTFSETIKAPTGLYGMVSEQVHGPYRPLNGTGLVVANPPEQPYQAYSWLVSSDLSVSSFVDMLDGRIERHPGSPRYPVGQFEGTVAPQFQLRLDGATAIIENSQEARSL